MKRLSLFIFFLFVCSSPFAQTVMLPGSVDQLNDLIKKVPEFNKKKQTEINALKKAHSNNGDTSAYNQIRFYQSLYEAYKLFQYDSAYYCARKLLAISSAYGNRSLINNARMKIGFLLLSSGLYKEALDTLHLIDIRSLPDACKAEYYSLLGRFYYDLADYDKDLDHSPGYNIRAAQFIDSALNFWEKKSYSYLYYDGLKKLRAGKKAEAKLHFDELLSRPDLTPHQVAVTASTLSDLYIQNEDHEHAINLLSQAVIADIQSSTKETSAAFILSTLLFKKGDIRNASLCINQAFSDAVFYGARQRKVQVSAILPLIEAQKLAIVESQRTKLIWYAALVTFLLFSVVTLAIIVYKQVQRSKVAQKLILEAHVKTQEINRRLSETNEKLNDANKIKEEYIGYFFNVNSEFFDKIERFKKSVEQKIADRKLEEIRFLVNNINLKREKEELIKHFDRAFLRLFPNFVAEFNELFNEEDRVVLPDNELLNTDLRIFALARMGIHENEKIAHILQYSVNTINTYKTRVKNKSIVANEEFEKRIMKIRTV